MDDPAISAGLIADNVILVLGEPSFGGDDKDATGRRLARDREFPIARAGVGDSELGGGTAEHEDGAVTAKSAGDDGSVGPGNVNESDGVLFVGTGIGAVVLHINGPSAVVGIDGG